MRRKGGAPKWRALWPVLALLLYFNLVHALTHAEVRLSEPLQPFLLVILAGAFLTLMDKFEDPRGIRELQGPATN